MIGCMAQAHEAIADPAVSDLAHADLVNGLPSDTTSLMEFREVAEEDILIFAIHLNKYVLSEGVILYQGSDRYFVSLSGLMDALEFPITVDVNKGAADGWYLNDDRPFSLNLRQATTRVMGKAFTLSPDKIHRLPDDLYVEISELSKWFPILLEIDFQNLTINISAQEPLPIEERIAKESRREQLIKTEGGFSDYRPVKEDVPIFSRPYVDTNITIDGNPFSEQEAVPAVSQKLSINASAIVLKQDARLNIFSSDFKKMPIVHMNLGRKTIKPELMGPLKLREYGFGDVNTPSISLVSSNTLGRGFILSSYELDRLTNSNNATLRGELPAGWEVELYRNGILLDFQTDSQDGRYEFADVVTLAGLNVFKMVFYGPQGQKREEFRRYYSDRDVITKGQSNFRLAVNQKDRNVITANQNAALGQDFGSLRIQAMGEYGLMEKITLVGSFSSLSFLDVRNEYYQAGLHSNFGGLSSAINVALDDTGGTALDVRTRTRLKSLSLVAEHSRFYDYISEVSNAGSIGGELSSKTRVTLNGVVSAFQTGHMPFTLRAEYIENTDGQNNMAIFGRLSKYFGRFALTAENRWIKSSHEDTRWEGAFLTSTLIGTTRFRGMINYRLKPQAELTTVNLSSLWRLDRTTGMTVGMNYQNLEKDIASLSFGLHKDFEKVKLNAKLDVDSQGEFYVGFGLSMGFGLDPRRNDLYMSRKQFASTGMISPRVFLDKDNDLTYSDGDELLEDVQFASNRSINTQKTDQDGQMLLTGMPLYKTTYLAVNEGSLKNPYLMSTRKGVSVNLRPGYARKIDFPIQETGEIDGTIYKIVKGRKIPAQGIIIILKSLSGDVVAQQIAAYDGFYLFDGIAPGPYMLEFDQAQLAALDYKEIPARPIQIAGEESMVYGMDYTLESLIAEAVYPDARNAEIKPKDSEIAPQVTYGLHVLSFLHERNIQPGWDALRRVYPEILNDREIKLTSFDHDQTYIRLIAGRYTTLAAASKDCKKIIKGGEYCRVMLYEGKNWISNSLKTLH